MNSLAQQKSMKVERQRKQARYKSILDEQVQKNKHSRQNNDSMDRSYLEETSQDKRLLSGYSKYQEKRYFPTIKEGKNRQNRKDKSRKAAHLSISSEDDRTQIYLSNCEQIIKNLRQLKAKRKKLQTNTMASAPSIKSEKADLDKVSVQYHPGSNHFSSQGKAYNKNLHSNNQFHQRGNQQLNSYHESQDASFQERTHSLSKNQYLIRKKKVNSLGKDNRQNYPETQSRHSKWQVYEQSDIPSGLQESQMSSKVNGHEKRQSQVHSRSDFVPDDYRVNENRLFIQPKTTLNENSEQKKVLSQCIIQLTKYLRNQNNTRNQPKSQENRDKHHSKTQQISVQTTINPQVNTESPQKYDRLKNQTIDALRQLHNKSGSNDKNNIENRQKYNQRIDSPIKVKLPTTNRSSYLQSTAHGLQKDQVSARSPKSLQIQKQFSLKTSQQRVKDELGHTPVLKDQKNSELISLLKEQLERQGQQNEELSYCLRELTQYLKEQNQELEGVITSRLQPPKSHYQSKSLKEESKHEEENNQIAEKSDDEVSQPDGQQNMLQNVFLKNLKKVRIRGSLFKEKIQSYRRKHAKLSFTTIAAKQDYQNDTQKTPLSGNMSGEMALK